MISFSVGMNGGEGLVQERDARRHHETGAELEELQLPAGQLAGVEMHHAGEVRSSIRLSARALGVRCERPSAQPVTSRLSKALMRGKTRVSWNMRSTPSRASASGRRPVMSFRRAQLSRSRKAEMTAT